MKKQTIVTILALLLATGLIGCGKDQAPQESQKEKEAITTEQVETAEETATEVPEKENTTVATEIVAETQDTEPEELTLDQLSEAQLAIFKEVSECIGKSEYEGGLIDLTELQRRQANSIDYYIQDNMLPLNGKDLYNQWLEQTGYYDSLKAPSNNSGNTSTGNTNTGNAGNSSSGNSGSSGTTGTTGGQSSAQTNKPHNSGSQQQQQVQDSQNNNQTQNQVKPDMDAIMGYEGTGGFDETFGGDTVPDWLVDAVDGKQQ